MKPLYTALFSFLFLVLNWSSLQGDSVYGSVVHSESVDVSSDAGFSLHLEELSAISLHDTYDLIEAIELEIIVPEIIAESRNSFALYLYTNCSPAPSANKKTYSCEQAFMNILPSGRHLFYHLPVTHEYGKRSSFDTVVVESPLPPDSFPLLLTLMPVMKGIPDGVYSVTFDIQVRPVLKNKGIVQLALESEEGIIDEESAELITIILDEKRISSRDEPIMLQPGIHTIEVISPDYMGKKQSFTLDKGEIKEISVVLKKSAPKVLFEAPENSKIFLDGEHLDFVPGEHVSVTEGEHTVLFQLGDYSLSKRFQVEKGKSYIISLSLDIIVKER